MNKTIVFTVSFLLFASSVLVQNSSAEDQSLQNMDSLNFDFAHSTRYKRIGPEAIKFDDNVDSENEDIFTWEAIIHDHGYDWAVPGYWFWDYTAFGLPTKGDPATWFIPTNGATERGDWSMAKRIDSASCFKDHLSRRIQVNFPRQGDFACVPVPTDPAIWVHNPNHRDKYLTMVAVTNCPKGLVATVSNWPTTGDMDCETSAPAPTRSITSCETATITGAFAGYKVMCTDGNGKLICEIDYENDSAGSGIKKQAGNLQACIDFNYQQAGPFP